MKFVLLNPDWKVLLCNFKLQDDYKPKTRRRFKSDRGLL